MRKGFVFIVTALALAASLAMPLTAQAAEKSNTTTQRKALSTAVATKDTQQAKSTIPKNSVPMYRLYQPRTGEHFYTGSVKEKRILTQQREWIFEGVAWYAPKKSKTPVYRLCQLSTSAHHYTTSANERDTLKTRGWRYEGIGWYSDDAKTVRVHRLVKPGAEMIRAHHFTTSDNENNTLIKSRGWKSEGIGWYAMAAGHSLKDGWVKQKVGQKTVWTYWLEGKQLKGLRWVLTCQKPVAKSDDGIQRYYLNNVGHAVKGLFKDKGKSYFGSFDKVHVLRNEAQEINGKWYWADDNGVLQEKLPYADRVPQIWQNPELPTGCESVSLTMVLRAYGFSLGKTTIVDNYLSYSGYDFVHHFVGDPYGNGAGIYAPGITNTANRFLKAKGSKLRAHNISGASFEELLDYTKKGIPVLVWSTMYMNSDPHYSGVWASGKQWYNYEHCVVLKGTSGGKVLVNDPLSGNVKRSYTAFRNLYYRCGSMAVAIW